MSSFTSRLRAFLGNHPAPAPIIADTMPAGPPTITDTILPSYVPPVDVDAAGLIESVGESISRHAHRSTVLSGSGMNSPIESRARQVPIYRAPNYLPNPEPEPFASPQNIRDAGVILREAFPTYSGLSNVLDRTGYRSLSQSIRDLNDNVRLNILARAEWLSTINPMANRVMSIRTDFITSEGFSPKASSMDPACKAAVQKVLDDHWQDNEWDAKMFSRVLDCGITGEIVRRVPPLFKFVPGLGERFMLPSFKCGNLYPYSIERIDLDPYDYERQEYIHFQPAFFPQGADCTYRIVRRDRINPDEFKRVSGDIFYLGFNRRTGQSRGLSDLTPCIEWLDMHDESLYTDSERVALMMKFIWDITLKGASPAECTTYAQALRKTPPKSGTMRVHDEHEIWEAKAPDLNIVESAQNREALFEYAWGGMGLPKHFFVDSENVNKCFSSDTYSLTEAGWKLISTVTKGERVATRNMATGELEFQYPSEVFEYDYAGEMVHFLNKNLDILVTPNHNMQAKRLRYKKETMGYESIRADQMDKNGYWIPVAAKWTGGNEDDFVLPMVKCSKSAHRANTIGEFTFCPDLKIPGDLWAKFLGYVISEGFISSENHVVTIGQTKPQFVPEFRDCIEEMNALGFNFRETTSGPVGKLGPNYVWSICDKGLHAWLSENCGIFAANKKIPEIAWNWTARRMRILLNALIAGDGSRDPRENRNPENSAYYTCSSQLVDDVQRLCCQLNMTAKPGLSPTSKGVWYIRILNQEECFIRRLYGKAILRDSHPEKTNGCEFSTGTKAGINRVPYNGKVYCMETPNHTLITRRNGKISVTSNSNAEYMQTPVFAWARNRRKEIKEFLELECQLAVQVARDSGRLRHVPPTECTFTIVARDPDRSNYDTAGKVLKDMGDALTVAVSQGFINQQIACRMWKTMAGSMSLGFEDDPDNNVEYDQETGMDVTDVTYPKGPMPMGLPDSKLVNAMNGVSVPGAAGGNVGGGAQESMRSLESYMRESQDRLEHSKHVFQRSRVDDVTAAWVATGQPDGYPV